jgi:ribosomal protein L23
MNQLAKDTLILGIDLSFNSTGICTYYVNNSIGKEVNFHRIVYNKLNEEIENVKTYYYQLPINISIDALTDNDEDTDKDQLEATFKGLMIKKVIEKIFSSYADKVNCFVIVIENYIMPSFSGKNQLKTVGGLIQLQGYIRELFIERYLTGNFELKFYFPTPSHNKYLFTLKGNATKDDMIEYFLKFYNGNSLLPNISKYKIDDLVDAFSLMIYGYKHFILPETSLQILPIQSTKSVKKRKTRKPENSVLKNILQL